MNDPVIRSATEVGALRLTALMLPAAIGLHEAAYAVMGGSELGAHGYLETAVPLLIALAVSLTLASVLLPALGRTNDAARAAPFAIAAGLLCIFFSQELAEALLFGGGWQGFAASAAAAWLAPPLALLLGGLASALIVPLAKAGDVVAALVGRVAPSRGRAARAVLQPAAPPARRAACSGLRFGFARRPPPRYG